VEDFGPLALEPRAFACGHDGDREFWGVHRHYRLMFTLLVRRGKRRSWPG
jgi:hypothetical protein